MASPKAAFYTNHLFIALTAGDWTSDTPSRAVNKVGLSWSELLRKFRKHCPQSHVIAELASNIQTLSLLLIRSQKITPEAMDGDHTNPEQPLTLGAECLLQEERREEAQRIYNALQKLPKSDSVYLALAYYAFALGRYDDSLSQVSSVKYDVIISSANASNVGTLSSALSVPVSQNSRTTSGSATGSFTPSMATMDSDGNGERIWAISEHIRGKCLQGMAYESLSPPSIIDALVSYESALPLVDQINIPKSLPSLPGKTSVESFTRYRELWRWVERLLWRASILSAKTRRLSHTHRLLKIYQAHSIHWPPTYRPAHRSTISQLHLHVLLRTYTTAAKIAWLNEMRSLVTDYRILLTATTTFPRAGQRNFKVEEFVDLCMAAWEMTGATGEQTGWVIDILWWATRLTFNSPRVYRHLTRTLYVSGDADLARRTLKLYVQIVRKARETSVSQEHDRIWVETLVQGARMLCRMPGGIEEAQEAGELLRLASERLDEQDKLSVAALRRAEGIWHACMALRAQEPLTRPTHLASSLSALKESLALQPTPSTYFHLALALSRPGPSRDLGTAIAYVREAVEEDPREIRYWHLLGLLLAATEDWKGAKAILEIGAGVSDGDELEGGEEAAAENPVTDFSNGHVVPDAADSRPNSNSFRGLLAGDLLDLPAAATLERPVPDHPPSSRHERFDHALQLRLTQLALIEHVDGPENAGDKWVEVFSWVAARKGLGEEKRISSVEPPSSEGNLSDSATQHLQSHIPTALNLSRTHSPNGVSLEIPINLIPPSPREGAGKHDGVERKDIQDLYSLQEKDDHDTSKGKKVQRILKERVHKGQAHIHTISRKIGRGSGRYGSRLKRSNSAPDFHVVLSHSKPYQASSIHSRQRLSATYMRQSPEPPPPPATPQKQPSIFTGRSARERRLLSSLWLTSAATFRRMGKIEQARAAIQEAEVADEENEDVWVQLGLYFAALSRTTESIASLHKALYIRPGHVPALVYLAQQYLTPVLTSSTNANADNALEQSQSPSRDKLDLAAGLLIDLTRGGGWDVPEAWYFLARAKGLQGKRDRERECLNFALALVEGRGVRDIMTAIGWCL